MNVGWGRFSLAFYGGDVYAGNLVGVLHQVAVLGEGGHRAGDVHLLEDVTAQHMFGYAGATICPTVDALKDAPEIGYTLVRTEQNAGHMASG